ncbi:hypothetical protein EVAR_51719_1 [Eumeta japonica]|uniref:Uncharacterized protein n=1 Tax=Eumeta variegata TaxID=151549 RepID=A0A4C1XKH0_EUMVA|nr:hypothetical protein EVAR_51719_1 [Eumeta japonica]
MDALSFAIDVDGLNNSKPIARETTRRPVTLLTSFSQQFQLSLFASNANFSGVGLAKQSRRRWPAGPRPRLPSGLRPTCKIVYSYLERNETDKFGNSRPRGHP